MCFDTHCHSNYIKQHQTFECIYRHVELIDYSLYTLILLQFNINISENMKTSVSIGNAGIFIQRKKWKNIALILTFWSKKKHNIIMRAVWNLFRLNFSFFSECMALRISCTVHIHMNRPIVIWSIYFHLCSFCRISSKLLV